MHLFLRDSLKLSTVAVVGGSTIALFGFWHAGYGFSAPLLPLGLWLLDRAFAGGAHRWRFFLGVTLVNAFAFYEGISQVVLISAAIQLAYVVFVTGRQPGLIRRLAMLAWIWVLAVAMYGPVLLPVSQRTIWDVAALGDIHPMAILRDAFDRYSAILFGVPVGSGIGISPTWYGTYFAGAIGLPLLALGAVDTRGDRRRRFLLVLLVALPVIDVLAVLATPLQDQLGFLKSFQVVRVRHFVPFAVAAMAGIGLDRLAGALSTGGPIVPRSGWRRLVVVASVVPLAVTLAVAARQVIARRHALVVLQPHAVGWLLAAVALGIGLLAVVVFLVLRARRAAAMRRAASLVLVAGLLLLVGERAIYAHAERLIGSSLGTWADWVAPTPGEAFLAAQPGIATDRVLLFGVTGNRVLGAGLLEVGGYQSMYPLTYHDFFGALIRPQLDLDPAKTIYFDKWGNRASTFGPNVDPELVALAGARWLYVRGSAVPTVPGIVARFRDGDVTVYEVPDVLPRAFVAGAIDVLPDRPAVLAAMTAASLDDLRS
jgi:Protein of unknown function (DUF6044)